MSGAGSRGGRSQRLGLQPDAAIHLEVSGLDRERRLHTGRLLAAPEADVYRVRFERSDLVLHRGEVLQLYFDLSRTFTKQLVHAVARSSDDDGVNIDLRPVGEPVSAEARECYRASARAADVRAHLGSGTACEVVDVSASGFSVYTREEYPTGHALEATLIHRGESAAGLVRVRNLRRTRSGRLRCGLSCIDDSNGNSALGRALSRINLALQRAQLARRTEGLSESVPRPRFVPRRLAR